MAWAPQDFGRSVKAFLTRGTNYALLITTGTPGFLDLPTALHLYLLCHSILVVLSGAKIKESKVHSFMSSSNLHLKSSFLPFRYNKCQFLLGSSICFQQNFSNFFLVKAVRCHLSPKFFFEKLRMIKIGPRGR
jgi:hypothetical protein